MSDRASRITEQPLEWLPAPAAPETPDSLNRIAIRRFAAATDGEPCAVLILSHGFTGGINDLDYFARELVVGGGGRHQVWTVERRNHLLEDLQGAALAEAAHDPRMVLAYYLQGDPPGCVPVTQESVSFMRHWGLAVALVDLQVVVQAARAVVGPTGRVFLGGHSLGGMLAQCYGAWAFDAGPGYREIDGLVLIDGAVGGPAWTATTGLAQFETGIEAIRSGEYFWDEPERGATPQFGTLALAAGMAASLPEWRNRPSFLAPLLQGLLPLPAGATPTNEGLLRLVVDAETGPISSFLARVGTGLTDLQRIASALRVRDGADGREWYASHRVNAEVDLSSNLDSRHPSTAAYASEHALRLRHHGEEQVPVFGVVTGSREQKRERYQWYAATVATGDVTILDAPEMEHLDPLFAENDGRNRVIPALTEWLLRRVGPRH